MSVISFVNNSSVTLFCYNRADPEKMHAIIQENKKVGLSNREELELNLREADYIPVIASIWAEKSEEIRLNFLREKSSELHAPLLFEQGLAEFEAYPTIETVINVTLPLFKAAYFRIKQDAECSKDMSIKNGDAQDCLEMVYMNSLNKSTKKYLGKVLNEIFDENKKSIQFQRRLKTCQVAEQTLTQNLPNPRWLESHGLDSLFGKKDITHTASDCQKIRDAFAKKIIHDCLN